jgi:DNA polymerase-3 subunit epsilon
MKLFYYDSETTGLDEKRHAITQMAGIIVIDGVEKERFDIKMSPDEGQEVEESALVIQGKTRKEIEAYPSSNDGYIALKTIMARYVNQYDKTDKFFMVGYNVKFDEGFLRTLFSRKNDKYFGSWFWNPAIDVMSIAGAVLAKYRAELPRFNLEVVADYLHITTDGNLHDAAADIDITRKVFLGVADQFFKE